MEQLFAISARFTFSGNAFFDHRMKMFKFPGQDFGHRLV
jgi:hypothetical protein